VSATLVVVGRSRIDAVFERYSEIRRHRHGDNGRAQTVIEAVKQDLEQFQSKRSVLGCLRLRMALSGCIDVSGIRLLRPPRHAGLADAQNATFGLALL
jgi:hypothetical protein